MLNLADRKYIRELQAGLEDNATGQKLWEDLGTLADAQVTVEGHLFNAPAAAGVNVVAQLAGDVDEQTWTNITQMGVSRNIQVDFSALWDGGDIEISGMTVTGDDATEVIAANPGSVVEGVYGWSFVRRVRNLGTHSAGTADVQTGPKLAVGIGNKVPTLLEAYETTAGGRDETATLDANGLFVPTATPNGVLTYFVSYSLSGV